MKKIKKKWVKVLISVIAAVLAVVLIVAAVLFFPLTGKKHIEVWSAGQEFDLSTIQTVEKTPGEDFKILLLTDTQLWSNPADNRACFEQMDRLVEQTQPDMIATVGDNVSGATSRFLLRQFVERLDSYQIPWAAVFGNHDPEIPMTTLNWQGDQMEASAYSLFQKGPSNLYGCGNYAVNITENGTPVYTLFMLDNGRYCEYLDENGESYTKEIYMGYEQIAWYAWNVQGIAQAVGHTVPSMTFSHFALPEMRETIEQVGVYNEADGSYTIPAAYGFGKCSYLPGCAPVDSGFFDKCVELGSTTHIFCGHDHENNASVTRDGIMMTYGLKTGPSPAPWNFAEEMGGTLIAIHTDSASQQPTVKVEHIVMETVE